MMIVACGRPSFSARMTPTCANPWSSDWSPVRTRSNVSSRIADASAPAVTNASALARRSCSTWMARSAPRASASRITCATRAGPAEQTTTSPPCFSFSRSASSSAYASGSFISKLASCSRIHVFESSRRGCHSRVGTSLMQTAICMPLAGESLEHEGGIGATEAERIRQRVLDREPPRLVRHVIEIAVLVRVLEVDGGRRRLVVHGERGYARLEAAGRAEQMSRHRLGRRHRDLPRALAEAAPDRERLHLVAVRRRRAMRVAVVDLGRVDARALDRFAHHAQRSVAVL